MPEPDDPSASDPLTGVTPSGYQRTTGGNFHWKVPSVESLQDAFPQYEMLGLQGQGGMGAVFRARQKSLDRLVAIKVLPRGMGDDDFNFAERFKNEAHTMARLNHPGIVHVHDFGETADGLLFFVMEFVEGTDLHQLIFQQRQLPPSQALSIAAHVCDALAYAHAHGVIHRDIKPANVLLTSEGVVKVADFGLAKIEDPAAASLTLTKITMGTPDYVAPEALVPGGATDCRADLYAVGVMIHHMLMGEAPRGVFDLPGKHIPGLDPRIDAVIVKAMKQRPEERYQTAAELQADLEAILTAPAVVSGGAARAATPKRGAKASRPAGSAPANAHATGADAAKPSRKLILPVAAAAALLLGPGIWLLLPKPARSPATDLSQSAAQSQPPGTPTMPVPAAGQAEAPLTLDETNWLPLAFPADFGKYDGGVTQAPDGALLIEGGYGSRLRARWGQADVAVRARVRIPTDGEAIIGLRTDMSNPALRVVIRPESIEIVHEPREDQDSSDHDVLRRFDGLGSAYDPVKGVLITSAVLGSQCLVWLDETFLGAVSGDKLPAQGKILLDGIRATFSDIQWQIIGDTSAPVTPAPPALTAEDLTGVWSRPGSSSQCLLYPGGTIALIDQDGQEELRSDGAPHWTGWRWSIEGDKARLSTADGQIQEEWTLTESGIVAIRDIAKGGASTSKRSSASIPAIRPPAPPAPKPDPPAPAPPPPPDPDPAPAPVSNLESQIPPELNALQAAYSAAIAEGVTAPHEASMRQLDASYLAALGRTVAARQLDAAVIGADRDAIAAKTPLPPDLDTTPEALAALRATYRAKATEYDEERGAAHVSLLTPYISKLRELEADLAQKGRTADAAAVTTYREMLVQNPLGLPEPAKP